MSASTFSTDERAFSTESLNISERLSSAMLERDRGALEQCDRENMRRPWLSFAFPFLIFVCWRLNPRFSISFCIGQTLDLGWSRGRRQASTSDLGGSTIIMGHVSWGPQQYELTWVNAQIPKRPKSREDHAWGVYGTFGYGTSKCSLEALRPVRVRVSRERLHACHVNT